MTLIEKALQNRKIVEPEFVKQHCPKSQFTFGGFIPEMCTLGRNSGDDCNLCWRQQYYEEYGEVVKR